MIDTFAPTESEAVKIRAFVDEHNARHGREKTSIGGRFTYSFSPTSIGTVVEVRCFCGAKEDVTEYDSW